jgi:hypothetical protein
MLPDNRCLAFEILDLSQTNITNTSYAQLFPNAAGSEKAEAKPDVEPKRAALKMNKLATTGGFSAEKANRIVVR